jgi:hypothetical protein
MKTLDKQREQWELTGVFPIMTVIMMMVIALLMFIR